MSNSDYSVDGYSARGQHLSPLMIQALDRYVNNGYQPGGFLTAVLKNDFMTAVAKADENNIQSLAALAIYIYNELPATCHGSPELVERWLSMFESGERIK